jgi:hypothetical protein
VIGTQSGAVALVRAAALQQAHVSPADSVVVETPLPGGGAAVARFLLNTVPAWLQITGLVAGALVGVLPAFAAGQPAGAGDGVTRVSRPAADSFPHARHAAKLACLTCHQTGRGHGRLTFEPPRGCAICHHQAPAEARCASCHRPDNYATPKRVTVTVTVPAREPHARLVDFRHGRHESRSCVDCHTIPVTLAPSPAAVQCKDCHSDHHEAGRDCAACHANADPKSAHKGPETAHRRCDACHTETTIARLTPTRSFCGTCHVEKATKHHDQKECTVCHFLADPGAYRSKLRRPRT